MDRHSENIELWLKLYRADGVGPKTFLNLLDYFGSITSILGASQKQLMQVENVGPKTAKAIIEVSQTDFQNEIDLANKLGIWMITINDPRYPASLKHIPDPPIILSIKGTLGNSDNLAIAIVGSRRCTIYGQEQASKFAHVLSAAGFTIVSGMASGIDTAAHRGALLAKGRTIAVQGCGLANVFPPENAPLKDMIIKSGSCISELPIASIPRSENFPARNRIIAGLSMATIVIEAAHKSGSLITAKFAAEYNREVMAIPGRIDSKSSFGSNELLKQGAALITSPEDAMDAIGYIGQTIKEHVSQKNTQSKKEIETPLFDASQLNLSENEKNIYDTLSDDALHIEDIITTSQLPVGAVNSSLISLRLKGLIKQNPGSYFQKN